MKVKDILKGVLEHAAPTEVLPHDAEWYFKMGLSLLSAKPTKKTKRLGRPPGKTTAKPKRVHRKRTPAEIAKTTALRKANKMKRRAEAGLPTTKAKSHAVRPHVLENLKKAELRGRRTAPSLGLRKGLPNEQHEFRTRTSPLRQLDA